MRCRGKRRLRRSEITQMHRRTRVQPERSGQARLCGERRSQWQHRGRCHGTACRRRCRIERGSGRRNGEGRSDGLRESVWGRDRRRNRRSGQQRQRRDGGQYEEIARQRAERILDQDRCLHARPPRTPRGIDRTAVLAVGATSCLPCIAANPNFCNQWPQLRSIACSRRRPRPLLSGVRVVAWPCCRGPHRLRLGARPAQSADSAVACRIFLTLVTPRMRNPSAGRPRQERLWSFPRRGFAYRAGHPRRRGAHRRRIRALPPWLRTSALPAWSRPSGSPSAPASTP
ncbi:hypothetical protein SAMN05421681_103345 [Lysobacter enzymogenes]|nr:hypothetical protein SAMN05421681_103345 [Lysobacter enzymogenes]